MDLDCNEGFRRISALDPIETLAETATKLVTIRRASPESTMPLFKRIEVWRSHSTSRAICYNCVEDLGTGRFRVCTADFVGSGDARGADQERYFVEQILDWSPDDPEQPEWFDSLEAAIAAHDAAFEN